MTFGAVLLLGAAGLHFYNQYEAQKARESVEHFLPIMMDAIADNAGKKEETPDSDPQEPTVDPDYYSKEMTVTEIDGYDFIGYVSIPRVGLMQPVISETDKAKLKVAPCRYVGSTKTDDLIIGGHNNTGHFAPLHKVQVGDEVLFTDMDGKVWRYEIVMIETLRTSESAKLIGGDYDLTLFTCAYNTTKRVTVRCERVTEES